MSDVKLPETQAEAYVMAEQRETFAKFAKDNGLDESAKELELTAKLLRWYAGSF